MSDPGIFDGRPLEFEETAAGKRACRPDHIYYSVHTHSCKYVHGRRSVMKINSFCLACLIRMQESQIRKFDDEEKKMRYMREILAFLSSCNPDLSAPALVKPLARIYEKYWGKRDSMPK